MQNFEEQIRCIMGDVQVAYTSRWSKWEIIENVKSKNDSQTRTLYRGLEKEGLVWTNRCKPHVEILQW